MWQVRQNWEPDVGDDLVVVIGCLLPWLGKLHQKAAIKPWGVIELCNHIRGESNNAKKHG